MTIPRQLRRDSDEHILFVTCSVNIFIKGDLKTKISGSHTVLFNNTCILSNGICVYKYRCLHI